MEEVGVEETVVAAETKNATVVAEEEPVVVEDDGEEARLARGAAGALYRRSRSCSARPSSRPTRGLRNCWMRIVPY